jgi:hypothetical protein
MCVGTYGWEWPDWVAGYYPEDLPEDWRSVYYANEAFCVCLPSWQWMTPEIGRLEQWCEDLTEGFRFYLEVEATTDPVDALTRVDRLGPFRVAAVLASRAPPAAALAAGLGDRRIEVLSPAEPPPSLPQARLWEGATGGGAIRAVRLPVEVAEQRVWRDALSELAPLFDAAEPGALFLSGPGVTPTQAREFRVMAELMGVA